MRARVIKGGWLWKGALQQVGDVIDGQSDQWIAHRVRDGLCEVIPDEIPAKAVPEVAAIAPAETTSLPSQRASAKQRK